MASFSSSFDPPVPITIPPGGFDVFISFRGKDTRNTFTSHLHAALRAKHVLSFIDSKHLRAGDQISDSLLQAIAQSKLYIIVFSPNYGSSTWCLKELLKILHERRVTGKMVIPVFYGVEPSVIRYQTGNFKEAFSKHQESQGMETVKIWRDALVEAAGLSGYDSSSIRPESKLIEKSVEHVLEKLKRISSVHFKGLVGIDSRIEEVQSLICDESVIKVGIWGMGGIGKTTVAKSVFLSIRTQFQGSCFLENIREEIKRNGLAALWNKFVQEIFGGKSFNAATSTLGLDIMKERLRHAKVLVVFDDVDESLLAELQPLLDGEDGLFGKGSKILITSRDHQVLTVLADRIYKVEGLNCDEGLQLFSRNAFKQNYPPNDYMEMSKEVINYVQGNPLALKVLGASLCRRSKSDWDSALQKLQKIPKKKIIDTLKVSFDGLSPDEQNLFLDIAFSLRGEDRKLATEILNSSYYYSVHHIITYLIDKCLITVTSNNRLEMHDLLQEMGWYIVRQESSNPEERSRLQDPLDVYDVLIKKKGTRNIRSINLNLFEAREMHLDGEAFMGMDNLRIIKIFGVGNNEVYFRHHDLQFLPDTLKFIHWGAFPLKSLPSLFSVQNLVNLKLPRSKIERLWTGKQDLVNLRSLNLSWCVNLIEIPDLSNAKNIERINLSYCRNLVTLDSSVQHLNKLQVLDLRSCAKLRNLPRSFDSKYLKYLRLGGCSNVRKLPDLLGDNSKDLRLFLSCTGIEEIPSSSIQSLTLLPWLNLSNNKYLSSLPTTICKLQSLRDLDLSFCPKLEEFPEILEPMERLGRLQLSGCENLKRLPTSICKLKSLQQLDLSDCPRLEEFPEILEPMEHLRKLDLSGCENLKRLPSSICKLNSLIWLDLNDCRRLEEFPDILEPMEHLETLYLCGCETLMRLPADISNMKSLKLLSLGNCKLIRFVPKLPQLLQKLNADSCESLETLLSSNTCDLSTCSFVNCCRLDEKIRETIMANAESRVLMKLDDRIEACLPGTEIPKWLNYRSLGSSVTVTLPSNHINPVKGITFCVVYECTTSEYRRIYVGFKCYGKDNKNSLVYDRKSQFYIRNVATKSEHMVLYHPSIHEFNRYFLPAGDVLRDCSRLSLEFWSDHGDDHVLVKECGFHLHFADEHFGSHDEGYYSSNDELYYSCSDEEHSC